MNKAPKQDNKFCFFSSKYRADNAPDGSNYWFGFTAHQQGTGLADAYFVQVAFSTAGDYIATRAYLKKSDSWTVWKRIQISN